MFFSSVFWGFGNLAVEEGQAKNLGVDKDFWVEMRQGKVCLFFLVFYQQVAPLWVVDLGGSSVGQMQPFSVGVFRLKNDLKPSMVKSRPCFCGSESKRRRRMAKV